MKKGTKVSLYIKAGTGDRVWVKNYRKRPEIWEPGEVYNVEATIRKDLSAHVSYRVRLDRESWSPKYGGSYNPIFVTVGDDGIQ